MSTIVKIKLDHSGLEHFTSRGQPDILLAATEALRSQESVRPLWFWHDEFFCPVDRNNDTPIDIICRYAQWKSEFESNPRNLIRLLDVPESSEVLIKDIYGIWHYKSAKYMILEEAAALAVSEPADPEDVTFFWFKGFICPIRLNDTGEKLATRWIDWERGYRKCPRNILWFFQEKL